MGGVLILWLIALGGLNLSATAENIVINNCNDGWGCGNYYDDDRITVFDDRVFDIAPPANPSSDHPYGKAPPYTEAQRKAWVLKCAPYKRVDSRAFRECFQIEKEKALTATERQYDEVQKRRRTDGYFYLPAVH